MRGYTTNPLISSSAVSDPELGRERKSSSADAKNLRDKIRDVVASLSFKVAASLPSIEMESLVDLPGSPQVLLSLLILTAQKFSLLVHIDAWPRWFETMLAWLWSTVNIELDLFPVGLAGRASGILLVKLAIPLLVLFRFAFVTKQFSDSTVKPAVASSPRRALSRALFVPMALSMPSFVAGWRYRQAWPVGLGVLSCFAGSWALAVECLRLKYWPICVKKKSDEAAAIILFRRQATVAEGGALLICYTSFFLTSIGGLLEFMQPGRTVAVRMLSSQLLVFYVCVPIVGVCGAGLWVMHGMSEIAAMRASPGFQDFVNDCESGAGAMMAKHVDDPTNAALFANFATAMRINREDDTHKAAIDAKLSSLDDPLGAVMAALIVPFERKFALMRALMLLEAAIIAACAVLPSTTLLKLGLSTAISAVFLAVAMVTRPYLDPNEDRADLATRGLHFASLVVGILAETQTASRPLQNVALGSITLGIALVFAVTLNPLKLVFGVRRAMRDAASAVRAAKWDEEAIKTLDHEISIGEWQACSAEQKWWLIAHHGRFAKAVTGLPSLPRLPAGLLQEIPRALSLFVNLRYIRLNEKRLGGELPIGIIRMNCNGTTIVLHDNDPGFTLPSNIAAELGDDITELDISNSSLRGKVPDDLSALLVRLERFDFSGNDELDQTSFAGRLACNFRTLKNITQLDFSMCDIQGALKPLL